MVRLNNGRLGCVIRRVKQYNYCMCIHRRLSLGGKRLDTARQQFEGETSSSEIFHNNNTRLWRENKIIIYEKPPPIYPWTGPRESYHNILQQRDSCTAKTLVVSCTRMTSPEFDRVLLFVLFSTAAAAAVPLVDAATTGGHPSGNTPHALPFDYTRQNNIITSIRPVFKTIHTG